MFLETSSGEAPYLENNDNVLACLWLSLFLCASNFVTDLTNFGSLSFFKSLINIYSSF
jgi:hypothetical protein